MNKIKRFVEWFKGPWDLIITKTVFDFWVAFFSIVVVLSVALYMVYPDPASLIVSIIFGIIPSVGVLVIMTFTELKNSNWRSRARSYEEQFRKRLG